MTVLGERSQVPKKRIEKLTEEQTLYMPIFRDEWTRRGLATGPCDRPAIEAAVKKVYKGAGKKEPEIIIWVQSPLGGCLAAALLSNGSVGASVRASVRDSVRDSVGASVRASVRDSVKDSVWASVGASVWASVLGSDSVWGSVRGSVWAQTSRCGYGQHDAGWVAWSRFLQGIGANVGGSKHELWLEAMDEMMETSWWWPFENAVVLSERPITLNRDAQGRLHSTIGQAIGYPDGWGVWAVHGVRVQQWVIEQPELITPDKILSEQNQEVRRVMVEQMPGGWPSFVDAANLKLLDECPDPGNSPHTVKLYALPVALGSHKLIIVDNATIERDGRRKTYGVTVSATCKTALEAAASTFGLSTAEYKQLARAT
jgi:hypothetical protein